MRLLELEIPPEPPVPTAWIWYIVPRRPDLPVARKLVRVIPSPDFVFNRQENCSIHDEQNIDIVKLALYIEGLHRIFEMDPGFSQKRADRPRIAVGVLWPTDVQIGRAHGIRGAYTV